MVEEVSPEMVRAQLDAIFTDIVPDSVKIGMVSSSVIIEAIVEKLMEYQAVSIVLDPVMVSTSGSRLLNEEAMSVLIKKLMPLATMIVCLKWQSTAQHTNRLSILNSKQPIRKASG